MNPTPTIFQRLWFGLDPKARKSRFHTVKGQFSLRSFADGADCVAAVATGVARKFAGMRLMLPWITFPAIRFLRSRINPDTQVFEWSCGMSTLWFERRCGDVWAVEDDRAWYEIISRRVTKAKVFLLEGPEYLNKILEHPPGYFDLISVDGSYRSDCVRLAVQHIRPGGLLLVDNTDWSPLGGDYGQIDQILEKLGPDWDVHRFPGWGPGNFYAWETTVCVRK